MSKKIQNAFNDLKEVVKVSKMLNQSSTYLKMSGFEFNGKTDNFMSYEDKKRLTAMIDEVQKKLNRLSDAIKNENLD
jgi:hypothetical protein